MGCCTSSPVPDGIPENAHPEPLKADRTHTQKPSADKYAVASENDNQPHKGHDGGALGGGWGQAEDDGHNHQESRSAASTAQHSVSPNVKPPPSPSPSTTNQKQTNVKPTSPTGPTAGIPKLALAETKPAPHTHTAASSLHPTSKDPNSPFNALEIGFPGHQGEADLPEGLSSVIEGMQRKGLLLPTASNPTSPNASVVIPTKITDLTIPLILSEPALLNHFMGLLLKQFAEENIIFLKQLGDLRQLVASSGMTLNTERNHAESKKLRELESFMVNEFLLPNSPMEINISERMRKQFLDQFKNLDDGVMEKLALFEPPEAEIVQLLTKNFLYSFKSNLAQELHSSTVPIHVSTDSPVIHGESEYTASNLPGSTGVDVSAEKHLTAHTIATPTRITFANNKSGIAAFPTTVGAQRTLGPKAPRVFRMVIVGGGFCGSYLVRELVQHPNIHITLIDNKHYFEYTASVPKVMLQPTKHKDIVFSHEEQLKQQYRKSEYTLKGEEKAEPCPVPHRYVCGEVSCISPSAVHVGLETIQYDVLVVATGLHYPSNFKNTTTVTEDYRGKQLMLEYRRIKEADSCLVIGGGSTGIEIAFEIRDTFPDKPIEIVAASPSFLHRNVQLAHELVVKRLEEKNIKWAVSEEITKYDERRKCFVTNKGRDIIAGKAFWCGGPTPLTSFMSQHFSDQLEKGYIRVNNRLQWEGYSNMFAGGDCCNTREEKMACRAIEHAYILAHNIQEYVAHKLDEEDNHKPHKMKMLSYKPPLGPDLQLVSMGTDYGIVIRHGDVVSGRLVGMKDEAETIVMDELKQGKDVDYYPYRVLNLMDIEPIVEAVHRGDKPSMPNVPPPGYNKSMYEMETIE